MLLLFAIGYAGKLAEVSITGYSKANSLPFPTIEYVLWAILLGLVVGNDFGGCR